MVQEYHIYQSIWDAAMDGKVLNCYTEVGNTHNPLTVAVKKDVCLIS